MNKKLFSWKALAGLALLVAMGLTSCKQDTVVDPTDPYSTTKPVQPGVVTGSADLTIRVVKPSDFNTQFTTWIKSLSPDDLKAKVTDKSSFTIDVQTGSMKLASDATVADLTMTIPAQLDGKTVTVNLLNAFAEKKNVLYFNVPANNDKVVTINLPADEFAFNLTNTQSILDLGGSATISRFEVANAAGAQKPVTIGAGLTVKNYASAAATNYIKVLGTINAIEVAAAPAILADKGVEVAGSVPVNWATYRVKSYIATADMTINAQGYKGGEIENLYIAAGKKVTLQNTNTSDAYTKNNLQPYVKNIVGLGAGSSVEFVSANGLTNVAAITGAAADKQIAVTTTGTSLNIGADIFTNASITEDDIYINSLTSFGDATLNGDIMVTAPAATSSINFNSVAFGAGSNLYLYKIMNLTPVLDADGNQAVVRVYDYMDNITAGTWQSATSGTYVSFSDIPASILSVDPTGSRGYWYLVSETPLYEETGDDIAITFILGSCKYNGKALNQDGLSALAATWTGTRFLTYNVDGVLYRWANVYDSTKAAWGWEIVKK